MEGCEVIDPWPDQDDEQRLATLRQLAAEVADEWGFVPPEVVATDGDHKYDRETNQILLNMSGLNDPTEAIDTVFHELGHIMQGMDHQEPDTGESEWDEDYPAHDDIYAFGSANAESFAEECDGGDSESGSDGAGGIPFDW